MSDIAKRFPFDAHPKGWFQVAYLHYFGRRLICYRGSSGNPYVLNAYCPHLGADISIGEMTRTGLGFARGEGAITEFRAWARQSYEEAFA